MGYIYNNYYYSQAVDEINYADVCPTFTRSVLTFSKLQARRIFRRHLIAIAAWSSDQFNDLES